MTSFKTSLTQAHAYRLTRLARLLRRHLERTLDTAELGLSVPHFFILMRLHEEDGRIQGDLVDPTMDDRANITRLVGGLVERGLVVRHRDEEDRRRQRVFLTAAGTELLEHLQPVVLAARKDLFGGLSPEDVAALERVLNHLEQELE